ncbi:MAG: fatty acid desaturase [Gallionellaceae bacterium]|jgi:fatty acid desaturase|nr:fatty acid desaturase [Gallionellaceae bacterium]
MPGILNSVILLVSMLTGGLLLWCASHLSLGYALLAAWLFCLVNNVPFSLTHEAVHGIGAKSASANRLLGTIAGWTFPLSFSMQRIAHLGHHQRNRTDVEMFDYYLPGQNKLLRNIWLYCGNLLGFYWVSVVAGNLVYLLAPWFCRSRWFTAKLAPALGFGEFVADIVQGPAVMIWLEMALAFGYQAALYYFLDLNLAGMALCYWAFALHWSALQYVDHAWSARDIRNGAWNLCVTPPARWLALNYHYHRVHHQHPNVPWYELPRWAKQEAEKDGASREPSFWRVYFSLWKGVRPAPPMGAPADLAFLFPGEQPGQNCAEN